MKRAIKIINNKSWCINNTKKNSNTCGIITDGDLKRIAQKYSNFENIQVNKVMKKIQLV